MMDVSQEEITNGSVTRSLLILAGPLVLQNLVQVFQQVADLFWLGRLSTAAVAAIGLNFPIIGVLTIAVVGIFVGTQVLVSQRVGQENYSNARNAVFHGILLAVGIHSLVAILLYLFATPIIRLVSLYTITPSVTELAATYLGIWGFALIPASMSDALEAGYVGWGDSRAALYINVIAVVTNIVLDPFFIFGYGPFPRLEIAGAAIATVLGYTAGFLVAIGMLIPGRKEYRLTLDELEIRIGDFRSLIDIGAPNAGEHLASQSIRVVIIGLVSVVGGSVGLAAYAIGARVASIAFIPASGLQQAAQSIIGQNIGAENPNRAARTTWIGAGLAAVGLTIFAGIQWIFPAVLANIFVPTLTGPELRLTVTYLRILAYGYWAIGALYLFLAGFNGVRRTRTSMIITLIQYWAVRLPAAFIGAIIFDYGIVAIFWAVTISNIVAAIGAGTYYWYKTSQGMQLQAVENIG
ncbi:MAG: MATE family efflux transporter [Halobacteriaceae archaeon]